MDLLLLIILAGIAMWLTLIFEALLGTRLITFKGRTHWAVHRIIGFTLIGVGLLHGLAAVGHLVYGWF